MFLDQGHIRNEEPTKSVNLLVNLYLQLLIEVES